MQRVPVLVHARDPISEAGVASQLRPRPEVRVVTKSEANQAKVAVVVTDRVDEDAIRLLRAVRQGEHSRSVLIAAHLDDAELATAVEMGAVGLLRRSDASPERMVQVITAAAAGDGSVPPDLLGRLLGQVGRLQRQVLKPRGLTMNGLTAREIKVLRLIADGYDTTEIARELSYSERTVKNVVHDITSRLHLRNRSHAVAFAMREGLI